jgi:hypothetical protein
MSCIKSSAYGLSDRRKKGQRGSALVESSLVLTIFLFMMVSALDFAQFLFIHQSLVEYCRQATRYAIVNEFNEAAIKNMVMYGSVDVPAAGKARFDLETSMITVRRFDEGQASDRVQVTISNFPFKIYTPLIAGAMRGLAITTTYPYEVI